MSLLAVELNDAGLLLVRTGDDGAPVLAGEESPGLAVLHEGRVHVGGDAVRRYRIAPLHAQNRFWQALSLDALPWSARGIATAADLAHAHLSALLTADARRGADELLLAVPPGYTREQLGLLVGVANECGVSVAWPRGCRARRGRHGRAGALPAAPRPATASSVGDAARGVTRRGRVAPDALRVAARRRRACLAAGDGREHRNGVRARDAVRSVAPGVSEQRLHDLLPSWLQALATADEIAAEIELGSTTHRIALTRAQLEAAVERLSDDILRLVQAARPPGAALHLCFSPRVASIPGLVGRLAALRDCVVVELAQGAPAIGALRTAAAIVRPADAIALVHRLPLADAQDSTDTVEPASSAVPAAAVPTHVLFRGRAWPITAVPLSLGWSVGAAPRVLTLPAGIAGVSRSHCTLELRDGQACVVDHSTYGTFVNDERIGGRLALEGG